MTPNLLNLLKGAMTDCSLALAHHLPVSTPSAGITGESHHTWLKILLNVVYKNVLKHSVTG